MPYTRGAEISRPWNDIVAEAHALVDAGAREIILLGQNVNAWTDGSRGLADLIRGIGRRSMGWSGSATPPAIPPT